MLQRTAKSCGPDAPMLASSSRSRVGPTGLRQNISVGDGGKRARSPGRARRKPLKPLRAGTSGDSGVLVVTRVRSTNTKCTRGRGCNGHPAFPTPSKGERFINASGALRGEVANACLVVIASEAKQSIFSYLLWRDGLLRFARNDVIMRSPRHALSRHRPRRRAIQYSEALVMESKSCSVLDTPLEPVIGLAGGETRWRSMTALGGAGVTLF